MRAEKIYNTCKEIEETLARNEMTYGEFFTVISNLLTVHLDNGCETIDEAHMTMEELATQVNFKMKVIKSVREKGGRA